MVVDRLGGDEQLRADLGVGVPGASAKTSRRKSSRQLNHGMNAGGCCAAQPVLASSAQAASSKAFSLSRAPSNCTAVGSPPCPRPLGTLTVGMPVVTLARLTCCG